MKLTPAEQDLYTEIYHKRKDRRIDNIKKAFHDMISANEAQKPWNRVKRFFTQPFTK